MADIGHDASAHFSQLVEIHSVGEKSRWLWRAKLLEGRDFVSLAQKGEGKGMPPRTEYFLTYDAAKHIGMMSGTGKGVTIREYFLDCERRAKEAAKAVATPRRERPISAASA